MSLIERLKEDHRVTINVMWPMVAAVGRRMSEDEEVPPRALEQIVSFLRGFFVEHHLPLEDALLHLAADYGVDQENPLVSTIIIEHEEAKNYIEDLSGALEGVSGGDSMARRDFSEISSELTIFLVRHETEENEDLFPLIQDVLSKAGRLDLLSDLAADEGDEKTDAHEPFYQLLREIEASLAPPLLADQPDKEAEKNPWQIG